MLIDFSIFGYQVTFRMVKNVYPQRLLDRANMLIKDRNREISWRIALIKSLREVERCGLKEAKEKIDSMFDNGVYKYNPSIHSVILLNSKEVNKWWQ